MESFPPEIHTAILSPSLIISYALIPRMNGTQISLRKRLIMLRSISLYLYRYKDIERSIIKRFRKEIWVPFIRGIKAYEMIKEGDKIAVCISGGKDSMLLAKCMQELQRHGQMNFELEFVCMNPGYNEINKQMIINNARLLNIPLKMFETQIFDIVAEIDESPCYLCARMRDRKSVV